MSLDDVEQLALARQDPRGFMAQRGDSTMVVGEAHRVPDLVLAIRAEVDQVGENGLFVVTGSSDFTASPRVPDSLAGRAASIRLGGLSQGELAGAREDFVTWLLSGRTPEPPNSPWTTNLTKRQIGRAKGLVVDSGLTAHVAGVEKDLLTSEFGRDALGDQMVAGIALTLSDHPHRHGDKLWGLPVSALWDHPF